MHLWQLENWKDQYDADTTRTGLRIHCEKLVDCEVKRALHKFCVWLRREFDFPVRVNVYVKAAASIKAKDGEMVSATFFGPYDHSLEPYIKISTGEYYKLKSKYGRDDAIASILKSLSHELSHYFQWLNCIKLTEIGMERQATRYSEGIISEYSEFTPHP